jgi:hypothetical protein
MQIVIETIVEPAHLTVELVLAGVREWRMPDVVREGERLRQILIQAEHTRDRPRNLRHFDRVRETIPKVIVKTGRENLRLVFQPAESTCVDNAITIPLEVITVGMTELGKPPPTALLDRKPEMREGPGSHNTTSPECRSVL